MALKQHSSDSVPWGFALSGLVRRPALLPCGAYAQIADIEWREWSRDRAVGSGTFDYADAYEEGAAPVEIRWEHAVAVDGRLVYRMQTLVFYGADADRWKVFTEPDIASLEQITAAISAAG